MESSPSDRENAKLQDKFDELLELEPRMIKGYVPEDAANYKAEFKNSSSRTPNHSYVVLGSIDFDTRQEQLSRTETEIIAELGTENKFTAAYQQFIDTYKARTRLMELASLYNSSEDLSEKESLRSEYMQLNIEQFGEPDEEVYRSLLQSQLLEIAGKEFDGDAAHLRDELFAMADFDTSLEVAQRYEPEAETIAWVQRAAETLYSPMLSRVEEKQSYSATEVRDIFEDIIVSQFGESAEEWQVVLKSANSINVQTAEKKVYIPVDRKNLTYAELRQKIVHELGVHLLRSVIGSETDLPLLAVGLTGYLDAEEGLGMVMEQAIDGKYQENGDDHYVTAGLSYFDDKDFRDIYETKWRLDALRSLASESPLTEDAIAEAKESAYKGTMRSLRGTDEMPWFKDLAYYNGNVSMWQHLESIRGDDLQFMFVLMGKSDPTDKLHRDALLETKSL